MKRNKIKELNGWERINNIVEEYMESLEHEERGVKNIK